MAKRFSDSDKWKREWFRELPPKMKAAWFFILDTCDYAGIWPADFKSMTFMVGEEVTAEECERHFTDHRFVKIAEKKYFVKAFVPYQYGKELNVGNNTHRAVLLVLEEEGVIPLVRGGLKVRRGKEDPQPLTGGPARVREIIDSMLGRIPV